MLENYGYEVIDLGKDVPIETVVETAKKQNIKANRIKRPNDNNCTEYEGYNTSYKRCWH